MTAYRPPFAAALVRATLGLILGGREIRLYRVFGCDDILPIDADYLAPLESKDYFVREMEGKPVLAVKEGMYIVAVIAPYDAFGEKRWRTAARAESCPGRSHRDLEVMRGEAQAF